MFDKMYIYVKIFKEKQQKIKKEHKKNIGF